MASSSSPQMELHNQGRSKFIEFPFVSTPHRELMANLLTTVENRLGSQLLPCTLPLDVQHCQNQTGTAQASLHIRSGHHSSPVKSLKLSFFVFPFCWFLIKSLTLNRVDCFRFWVILVALELFNFSPFSCSASGSGYRIVLPVMVKVLYLVVIASILNKATIRLLNLLNL